MPLGDHAIRLVGWLKHIKFFFFFSSHAYFVPAEFVQRPLLQVGTPLMLAMELDHDMGIIELLIAKGADIHATDNEVCEL